MCSSFHVHYAPLVMPPPNTGLPTQHTVLSTKVDAL